MTVSPERYNADRQLATARAQVTTLARRLAQDAARYAELADAGGSGDGARSLVHTAADLLRAEAALDGMQQFNGLVPDGPDAGGSS